MDSTRFKSWQSLVHDVDLSPNYIADFQKEPMNKKPVVAEAPTQTQPQDTFEMADSITIASIIKNNNGIG